MVIDEFDIHENTPPLPSPRIVWTLPDGREIASSGAAGMSVKALVENLHSAAVIPTGSTYREVPEDYVVQPTNEELAAQIRDERDKLIAETDYLVMPDYPLAETALNKVREYRQKLRDITEQKGFPKEVIWPSM